MKERLPKLCEHLELHDFNPDLIAFQWLACLFSINLPQHIGFAVWDLFFIKGISVIFGTALTVLSLMEKEILKVDKFEEIYKIIEEFCTTKLDTHTLMKQFSDPISMTQIEELRKEQRTIIMEMIKSQLMAQSSSKCIYPRLRFISNFYLYHGLSKFYQE